MKVMVCAALRKRLIPFTPFLLQPWPPNLQNPASFLHHLTQPPCGHPPPHRPGRSGKHLPAAPPSTTPPGPAQPALWTLQGTGSHLPSSHRLPSRSVPPTAVLLGFTAGGEPDSWSVSPAAILALCLLPLASLGVTRPASFRPCGPMAPATPTSESPEPQAGFPLCSRVTRQWQWGWGIPLAFAVFQFGAVLQGVAANSGILGATFEMHLRPHPFLWPLPELRPAEGGF